MDSAERPQIYLVTPPDFELSSFPTRLAAVLDDLAEAGLATSASGACGLAAVLREDARAAVGIGPDARVLCFLSEGPG